MYTLIELQTNGISTAIVPPVAYADRNEAESVYHSKLASAAVSNVDVHTVVLMDEYGVVQKNEFYEHKEG